VVETNKPKGEKMKIKTWLVAVSLLVSAGAAFAERIIVDNITSSPHAFTKTSGWTSSTAGSGYYGSNYLVATGPASFAARWRPYIATSGVYKIYIKGVSAESRASRVPIEINYDGGNKTENVRRWNQTHNNGVWVYVGSYYLSAGTGNSVRITAAHTGTVCADAVMFELSYATTTSPTEPALTTPRQEYAASIDFRDRPEEVLIVRTDSGDQTDPVFELRIEGAFYEVKGSCGHEAVEKIAAAGGNTIRAYSINAVSPDFMRRCTDAGIKVILGLWMTQVKGANTNWYESATNVSNQLATLKGQIDEYKNYEALLAWVIGNEIDPVDMTNPESLYTAVQDVARYVREVDHYHPTLTSHAGAHQSKIQNVVQWAPDIDMIGVNSYYPHVMNVTSNMIAGGWTGPHFITEYFLRQPLTMHQEEQGTNSWGAIIEPVSAEKKTKLMEIYADYILAESDRCAGSFVFKGSQGGFRVTHTWYPILDENFKPTPSYDAMRECWVGADAPELIAPEVDTITLNGLYPWESPIITSSGGVLTSRVTVTAPTNSTLEYIVEIRTNATTSTWSSPPPLQGITITQDSNDPRRFYVRNNDLSNGDYRLFYYVRRTVN